MSAQAIPHGTNYGYSHGCRCDECRTARREHRRQFKALRREGKQIRASVPRSDKPIPHGTANGYTNYRCRCDECRAAWSAYQKLWKQRWRERQQRYERETEAAAKPLLPQLEALEGIAAEWGYSEAVRILRMHIRATRLDISLDAVRRGEYPQPPPPPARDDVDPADFEAERRRQLAALKASESETP